MSISTVVKKVAEDAKKIASAVTNTAKSSSSSNTSSSSNSNKSSSSTNSSKSSNSNTTTNSNAGDWIGNSEKLAQTQNWAGTGSSSKNPNTSNSNTSSYSNSDYESELNKLKKLQQEATASQLKAQKEQTLQSLAEQEAEIQPKYYEQKRQAGATSQLGAKSFSEYLANRGLTNSGAAAQGEINRQSALQNTLGNLGTAEAQEYAQIARARQNAEQNYANSLASANAQIEADYYNNLITENQRQRQIQEQLQQQAAQQYSDDYQARINELLAQGYSPNSTEVLTLQALRGNKIANAQSGSNYNYAIAQIQNGNITYNNALNAGMTVQQAQDYYNQYQAQLQAQSQAEAEQLAYERNQQAITNAQKWAQINNDTRNTDSLIQQRAKSGSTNSDSTVNYSTHKSIIDNNFVTYDTYGDKTGYDKNAIINYIEQEVNSTPQRMKETDAQSLLRYYGIEI